MIERSLCYFKTRVESRATKVIREEDLVQRCEGNERAKTVDKF